MLERFCRHLLAVPAGCDVRCILQCASDGRVRWPVRRPDKGSIVNAPGCASLGFHSCTWTVRDQMTPVLRLLEPLLHWGLSQDSSGSEKISCTALLVLTHCSNASRFCSTSHRLRSPPLIGLGLFLHNGALLHRCCYSSGCLRDLSSERWSSALLLCPALICAPPERCSSRLFQLFRYLSFVQLTSPSYQLLTCLSNPCSCISTCNPRVGAPLLSPQYPGGVSHKAAPSLPSLPSI